MPFMEMDLVTGGRFTELLPGGRLATLVPDGGWLSAEPGFALVSAVSASERCFNELKLTESRLRGLFTLLFAGP